MKKNNKTAPEKTTAVIICTAAAVLVIAFAIWFLFFRRTVPESTKDFGTSVGVVTDNNGVSDTVILDNTEENSPFRPVDTDPLETSGKTETETPSDETSPLAGTDIGQGITLVDVRAYSGPYVEDGSNENVQNILSITVRNDSGKDIQYTEVYISVDDVFKCFKITTLPAGNEVTVLENSRAEYVEGAAVRYARVSKTAYFTETPSLYSDIFTVTGCDGYINLSNNSDTDITGDVIIYYKDVKDGVYFGGITYSVRASGGVGAKSSVLLSAPHFSYDSCKVLFINYEK